MNSPLYFPIVGCGGTHQAVAHDYDKRWLVTDGDGNWLSQSHSDRLADIQVELRLGYLVVRAPGMLRLDIPLDVIEDDESARKVVRVGRQEVDVVDEGDLVAAWMTRFLEQDSRLVKVHPDAGRVLWPEL